MAGKNKIRGIVFEDEIGAAKFMTEFNCEPGTKVKMVGRYITVETSAKIWNRIKRELFMSNFWDGHAFEVFD